MFYARVKALNQIDARNQFFELSVVKQLQSDGFSKSGLDGIHGKHSWNQVGLYCVGITVQNLLYTYLDTNIRKDSFDAKQFELKYGDEKVTVDPNSKWNIRLRQRFDSTYLTHKMIIESFDRLIEIANKEKEIKTFANKS